MAYGRTLAAWKDKLIVGGNFIRAGTMSARRLAACDDTAWTQLGQGLSSWVEGMAVMGDGRLAVCGWFNNLAAGGPSSIGL